MLAVASAAAKPPPANPSNAPPAPFNPDAAAGLRGMGGTLMGNSWLEEHLVDGYEGEWFTMNPNWEEDASVGDNSTSRFLNYYIEGQKWLYDELGLGGLYYDGFNGERGVQQRIRRMTAATPLKS